MRCTAAGDVLLGPEPPSAAGGIPGGYLQMIPRLDGADLSPRFIGQRTTFQPTGQSARSNNSKLNPLEYDGSMWLQCNCQLYSFMPAILELILCSLLFVVFSWLIWLPARIRPIPVIRGGGGIRAPMSARVWGREPW